jgi:hypothetical protein
MYSFISLVSFPSSLFLHPFYLSTPVPMYLFTSVHLSFFPSAIRHQSTKTPNPESGSYLAQARISRPRTLNEDQVGRLASRRSIQHTRRAHRFERPRRGRPRNPTAFLCCRLRPENDVEEVEWRQDHRPAKVVCTGTIQTLFYYNSDPLFLTICWV